MYLKRKKTKPSAICASASVCALAGLVDKYQIIGVSVKWCAHVKINLTQNNRPLCFPLCAHAHTNTFTRTQNGYPLNNHSHSKRWNEQNKNHKQVEEKSSIWIAYHMFYWKKNDIGTNSNTLLGNVMAMIFSRKNILFNAANFFA